MRRGAFALAFGVAAILGGAVACAEIVGIGDEPPTKLTCGALLGDGGCQACGASSCCVEMEACANSTPCRTLESCYAAHPDPGGRAQCFRDNPVGNDPTLDQLTACLASKCDNACGPACAWLGDFVGPDAATACAACGVAQACQPLSQCFGSPDCVAASYCFNTATTADRTQTCLAIFGDASDWSNVSQQILGACATECDVNHDWGCVGHVTWAQGLADASALTLTLSNATSHAPTPSVAVSLCPSNDPACDFPLETETTDSTGTTTLHVPLRGLGPTGYLQMQSDAGGFYPERYYWSFALSEPTVHFSTLTTTLAQVNAITAVLGIDAGSDRGLVVMQALDCRTSPAADVQFVVEGQDPGTQIFYYQNNFPSKTADRTDTSGLAAITNVPPGPTTVDAVPVGLGRPSAKVSFIVRAQTVAVVEAPVQANQ